MSKTLTSAAQAKLATKLAIEPVIIIEIAWGGTVGTKYYADKTLTLGSIQAQGLIQDFSGISINSTQDSVVSIGTANVTLSDMRHLSDGPILKSIIDTVDVFGALVKIYHHYDGLDEDDLILLFSGKVVTPFEWSEPNRTLSLSFDSALSLDDVGYAIEEETGGINNPNVFGKMWPILFGDVQLTPGLQLSRVPKSTLAEPIEQTIETFADVTTTLLNSIKYFRPTSWTIDIQFDVTDSEYYPGGSIGLIIDGIKFRGSISGDSFIVGASGFNFNYFSGLQVGPRDPLAADPDAAANPNYFWLHDDTISGGEYPNLIGLYIYVRYQTLDTDGSTIIAFSVNQVIEQDALGKCKCLYPFKDERLQQPMLLDLATYAAKLEDVKGAPDREWYYPIDTQVKWSWSIDVGTQIIFEDDIQTNYVVSDGPPCTVKGVYCERNGDLIAVPSRYYIKSASVADPFIGRTITFVTFFKDLTALGEGWTDKIYFYATTVKMTGSDVIAWLVSNYTDLTIDATTFAAVDLALAKYPVGFGLFNKKNVLTLIQEIAWQSRCVVSILNGIVYIKYISAEPAAVKTITEDEIEEKSFSITSESTDSLVTRITAKWRNNYYFSEPFTLERTANIIKYGEFEQVVDMYIYNQQSFVLKTVQFWLNRWSKYYKVVKFSAFLTQLDLDYYDAVTLNISLSNLFPSTKCVLINMQHDQHSIGVTLLTPIPIGSVTPSSEFWLDDSGDPASTGIFWPASEYDYVIKADFESVEIKSSDILGSRYDTDAAEVQDGQVIQKDTTDSIARTDTPFTINEVRAIDLATLANFRYFRIVAFPYLQDTFQDQLLPDFVYATEIKLRNTVNTVFNLDDNGSYYEETDIAKRILVSKPLAFRSQLDSKVLRTSLSMIDENYYTGAERKYAALYSRLVIDDTTELYIKQLTNYDGAADSLVSQYILYPPYATDDLILAQRRPTEEGDFHFDDTIVGNNEAVGWVDTNQQARRWRLVGYDGPFNVTFDIVDPATNVVIGVGRSLTEYEFVDTITIGARSVTLSSSELVAYGSGGWLVYTITIVDATTLLATPEIKASPDFSVDGFADVVLAYVRPVASDPFQLPIEQIQKGVVLREAASSGGGFILGRIASHVSGGTYLVDFYETAYPGTASQDDISVLVANINTSEILANGTFLSVTQLTDASYVGIVYGVASEPAP